MHTFVVRVLVAEDVDELAGVVEEPLSGLREAFHDAADLVSCLEHAIGRRPSADGGAVSEADAEGAPPTPRRL